MFNDIPAHKKKREEIGYWVSEKGKCNEMVIVYRQTDIIIDRHTHIYINRFFFLSLFVCVRIAVRTMDSRMTMAIVCVLGVMEDLIVSTSYNVR